VLNTEFKLTFSDFLGFYKLSAMTLVPQVDVDISSISLTTCLALCAATTDPSQLAVVIQSRCICSKGKERTISVLK
jgi:hypothetical protein